MTVNCLVPIDGSRFTYIHGRDLVGGLMVGQANWWTNRAIIDITGLGSWLVGGSGFVHDGANHSGNVHDAILLLASQPWPTVGGFLVAAMAIDDAYLGQYPTALHWSRFAFEFEQTRYRGEWCVGYEGDIPDAQLTTGTWLVVEGTGATQDAPSLLPNATLFALGQVLFEGTYADALAYRDAL